MYFCFLEIKNGNHFNITKYSQFLELSLFYKCQKKANGFKRFNDSSSNDKYGLNFFTSSYN